MASAVHALASARVGNRQQAAQGVADAKAHLTRLLFPEERIRCGVALSAALCSIGELPNAVATLRTTRRLAREHAFSSTFITEAAQYRESARLLLAERRIPEGEVARLQAAALETVDQDCEQTLKDRLATSQNLASMEAAPTSADTPSGLHIRLLGSPEVLLGGSLIRTWRTALAREVLFYLAVHAGMSIRRDRLLDDLLPGVPADKARLALRHAVHHLRRALLPLTAVETVQDGYRLDVSPGLVVDMLEFRRSLGLSPPAARFSAAAPLQGMASQANGAITGQREGTGEAAAADVGNMAAAISLYRGALLEGYGAEWVHKARATLAIAFVSAAEALLVHYERLGQHAEAARLAQHVLSIDPDHPTFRAALARHLAARDE